MSNRKHFAFIDINDESEGDIAYCPNCKKVKLNIKLGDVIRAINEIVPEDDNNFCQCPRCGKKYPIYEKEQEGAYSFPFPHVSNPFESGSNFESVEKRKKKNRLNDYREHEQ